MLYIYSFTNIKHCHKYSHDVSVCKYCANGEAEIPAYETLAVRSGIYK
jgi:hypothetical protein